MMAIPHLVGLYSSAPRSGKSTVASYLNGMGYRCLPFAAPIKEMTRTFLTQMGYSATDALELTEGDRKEQRLQGLGVTARHLMQTLGTEWGRSCVTPEVWLTCWRRAAVDNLNRGVDVVVDDIRFPNEADLVRSLGGELWCIERSEAQRTTPHASEGGLDDYPTFDRRIANNNSLLSLHGQVRTIVAPLSIAA